MAILGHKADVGFVALGPDLWALRDFQRTCAGGRPRLVDSYVSLTEVSEYAAGVPEEMKQARLLPAAAARGQAGVLLLPDVQAPRRPSTTGTRSTSTSARSLMLGHGRSAGPSGAGSCS